MIYRLCLDRQVLGVVFTSFRKHRPLETIDTETHLVFCDLVTSVLNAKRLQERLQQHTVLIWMSMLEDSWRHSLVQKAGAIRNYVYVTRRGLDRLPPEHAPVTKMRGYLGEIDRLAADISDAPVRVPSSWESQPERIVLASLLEEVAQREAKSLGLQTGLVVLITTEVADLGGADIIGYRRWLIYAIEILLQNAEQAKHFWA